MLSKNDMFGGWWSLKTLLSGYIVVGFWENAIGGWKCIRSKGVDMNDFYIFDLEYTRREEGEFFFSSTKEG